MSLVHPRCRSLCLPKLNFIQFLSSPFSVWSLEQYVHPPAFLHAAVVQKCTGSALYKYPVCYRGFPRTGGQADKPVILKIVLLPHLQDGGIFSLFQIISSLTKTPPAPLCAFCLSPWPSVCPYGLTAHSLDLTSITGNVFSHGLC